MEHDFGRIGRFVRVGHTRKMWNFASHRLTVQTLYIAGLGHLERAFHVHLDKIRNAGADLVTEGAVGRNGSSHGDYAIARQQLADEPNPPDVRVAILLAEAETFREMSANHIAIQQLDLRAMRAQPFDHQSGYGALTRARKAGEPERESLMHSLELSNLAEQAS